MNHKITIFAVAAIAAIVGCAKSASDAPAGATATVTYKDVSASITAGCGKCHSGPNAKEGIDVTSYKTLMASNVIVANDSKASKFATVLHGKPKQMPPKEALPADQIAQIEKWIDAGAKE